MNNSDMPAMAQDGCWKTDMEQHLSSGNYGAPSFDGIGLTKREHFAAMAMQSYVAHMPRNLTIDHDECALFGIQQADALLAALEAT